MDLVNFIDREKDSGCYDPILLTTSIKYKLVRLALSAEPLSEEVTRLKAENQKLWSTLNLIQRMYPKEIETLMDAMLTLSNNATKPITTNTKTK